MDDDLKRKLIAAAAGVGGLAAGGVFLGVVAAPVIGVGAGYLAYRRLGPSEDQANNTPPSSVPTINTD